MRRFRRTREAFKCGAVGVVAGGFTGAAFGACTASWGTAIGPNEPNVEEITHDEAQLQEKMSALSNSREQIVTQVGEKCITILMKYGPDQPLAGTHENIIVDDLFTNPTLPCGDDKTEVRSNTRTLLAIERKLHRASSELGKIPDRLVQAEIDQREFDEYNSQKSDEFTEGLIGLAVVGGLLGLGYGASVNWREKISRGLALGDL